MKSATWMCLALLAALVAPATAQDVEQVFVDVIRAIDSNGEVRKIDKVRITSATYEQVAYDLRGRGSSTRDGNEIVSITWGDVPKDYLDGLKALQNRNYEKAASQFAIAKGAVEIGKVRPWLLEAASLGRARALMAMADENRSRLDEAAKEYRAALEANPKSLWFDEIQLGLARAGSRAGKWNDAKRAAQALVDVGKEIKQPIWLCRGQEALAEVLLAQGEPQDAVNAYQDLVLAAQRELQWTKNEDRKEALAQLESVGAVEQGWARVARAEATGAGGDWAAAESYFKSLAARYPGNETVAAAVLNGLGRCLLEEDPRAAVMKFAEAEVVHFTAENEVARALYLKARAYEKMAAEGGSRYRDMAEEALTELREQFPESEWARKK